MEEGQPKRLFLEAVCGGLNNNAPHRLTYMNTWYPVSKAIWHGLGSVTLLEEVCVTGGGS